MTPEKGAIEMCSLELYTYAYFGIQLQYASHASLTQVLSCFIGNMATPFGLPHPHCWFAYVYKRRTVLVECENSTGQRYVHVSFSSKPWQRFDRGRDYYRT